MLCACFCIPVYTLELNRDKISKEIFVNKLMNINYRKMRLPWIILPADSYFELDLKSHGFYARYNNFGVIMDLYFFVSSTAV